MGDENSDEDLLACVVNDAPVADDDDDVPGGLAPGMSKAQKRKARARNVEQRHGGRDPALPSQASLRQDRRFRSFLREVVHDGKEEDLHIIYRNIEQLYSS